MRIINYPFREKWTNVKAFVMHGLDDDENRIFNFFKRGSEYK